MNFKFFFLISLIIYTNCFYTKTGPVVLLDKSNFEELVVKSKDIWLIEFYASWCGYNISIIIFLDIVEILHLNMKKQQEL